MTGCGSTGRSASPAPSGVEGFTSKYGVATGALACAFRSYQEKANIGGVGVGWERGERDAVRKELVSAQILAPESKREEWDREMETLIRETGRLSDNYPVKKHLPMLLCATH